MHSREDEGSGFVALLILNIPILAGWLAYIYSTTLTSSQTISILLAISGAVIALIMLKLLAYYHPSVSPWGSGVIARILNEKLLFDRPNHFLADIASCIGIALCILGGKFHYLGIYILVFNLFVIAPFAFVVSFRYD